VKRLKRQEKQAMVVRVWKKITAEIKPKMNPSDRKINTKNCIYNRSVQIQRGHNKIKATSRKRDPKLNFSIEFKQ
jgi:hypothetical protein